MSFDRAGWAAMIAATLSALAIDYFLSLLVDFILRKLK